MSATVYVKVEILPPFSGWYIAPLASLDLSDLKGTEHGEGYTVTRFAMTDDEFAKLPDFEGF